MDWNEEDWLISKGLMEPSKSPEPEIPHSLQLKNVLMLSNEFFILGQFLGKPYRIKSRSVDLNWGSLGEIREGRRSYWMCVNNCYNSTKYYKYPITGYWKTKDGISYPYIISQDSIDVDWHPPRWSNPTPNLWLDSNRSRDSELKREQLSVWGPKAWRWLHLQAIYFPHSSDQKVFSNMISHMRNHIISFICRLPCMDCRMHANQYIKQNPLNFDSNHSLQIWMWNFHNAVNKRLGSPVITYEKYRSIYFY